LRDASFVFDFLTPLVAFHEQLSYNFPGLPCLTSIPFTLVLPVDGGTWFRLLAGFVFAAQLIRLGSCCVAGVTLLDNQVSAPIVITSVVKPDNGFIRVRSLTCTA
jgi:hypothetical protein